MTMVLITCALYLVAAWLVMRRVARDSQAPAGTWLVTAACAIALHALYHGLLWRLHGTVDLHFFAALSLVGLGMASLTWLYAARGRMGALGAVVFPIAGLSVLAYGLVGGTPAGRDLGWQLELHVWLSLLAYATLGIAAVLAIGLRLQERALRARQFSHWLRALPPLTEIETLLFRSIGVGFVLLTGALLSGVVFVEDFFAQRLPHKTVLSVLSWLVFGVLLYGRWRHGWRGIKAVRLTLVAMALLVLAFFGSKFVYELVLGQGAG